MKLHLVAKNTWQLFICCYAFLCIPSLLSANPDPRLNPITSVQLRKDILSKPVFSRDHARLISRAYISHELDVAYPLYEKLAQQHPQNPYAQLWAGMAALDFQLAVMHPDQSALYARQMAPGTLPKDLFQKARTHLAQAYTLAPDLALVQSHYGWFLWQYGNDMPRGLRLLQQAAGRAPDDAETHCLLGAVYSNQSGNAYNLHKAVEELKEAVNLDPNYAQAHLLLSQAYQYSGKTSLALSENKTYQMLIAKPLMP